MSSRLLAALALLMAAPATPPVTMFTSMQTPVVSAMEFEDLAFWNNDFSSVGLLQGLWTTITDDNETPRLRADQPGCLVRMLAHVSGEEVTYHVPLGSEIVFHRDWTLINGSGNAAYALTLEDPPQMPEGLSYRSNEQLMRFSGRGIVRFTLLDGQGWQWTDEHALDPMSDATTWTAWNFGEANGALLGDVVLADGEVHHIFSAGQGVRSSFADEGLDSAMVSFTCKDPDPDRWRR